MDEQITIPRLDGEPSRAYEARVRYIVAGPQRSLEKTRQEIGARSVRFLESWSSRYSWVDLAAAYDQTVATLAARAAAERYQRDLEDHRTRYQRAGRDLYAVSLALLQACARAIKGQTIRGADGKEYLIPAMKLTPDALSTAVRGLLTAADLEAHALQLDEVLPRLAPGAAEAED